MGDSIVILIFFAIAEGLGTIFTNRNLNALRSEALAEIRALDHTGELLCAKDLEDIREGAGEDWGGSGVQATTVADVDEVHLESVLCSKGSKIASCRVLI